MTYFYNFVCIHDNSYEKGQNNVDKQRNKNVYIYSAD